MNLELVAVMGTTDQPSPRPADRVRAACHELIAALPDEAIPGVTAQMIEMLRHRAAVRPGDQP